MRGTFILGHWKQSREEIRWYAQTSMLEKNMQSRWEGTLREKAEETEKREINVKEARLEAWKPLSKL